MSRRFLGVSLSRPVGFWAFLCHVPSGFSRMLSHDADGTRAAASGGCRQDFKFEVEFLALLLSVRDGLGSDLGR